MASALGLLRGAWQTDKQGATESASSSIADVAKEVREVRPADARESPAAVRSSSAPGSCERTVELRSPRLGRVSHPSDDQTTALLRRHTAMAEAAGVEELLEEPAVQEPEESPKRLRNRRSMLMDYSGGRAFTIEDLKESWASVLASFYHGWAFLLAIVVLGGYSSNMFLNIFMDFNMISGQNYGALGFDGWIKIFALCFKAILLVLLFSGLMQRGLWLLEDAVRIDQFKDYRRSLCLEGFGPGTFRPARLTTVVTTTADLDLVSQHLTKSGKLEQDVPLTGQRVLSSRTFVHTTVPAGAQLLAVDALEGHSGLKCLKTLQLPARLAFRVDARPTGWHVQNVAWKVRAAFDFLFQLLIFLSLDVLPLIYAFWHLNFESLVNFTWVNRLVTCTVQVSIAHIVLYYIWSVLYEIVWNMMTMIQLARFAGLSCCNHRLYEGSGFAERTTRATRQTREDSTASVVSIDRDVEASTPQPDQPDRLSLVSCGSQSALTTQDSRRGNLNQDILLDDHAEGVGIVGEQSRNNMVVNPDDPLNFCVRIRNVASQCWFLWLMAFCCVGFLVTLAVLCNTDAPQHVTIGMGIGAAVSGCIFFRFYCSAADRMAPRRLLESRINADGRDDRSSIWALWYRVNCGLDRVSICIRQLVVIVVAVAVFILGITVEAWMLLPLCTAVIFWSVLVLMVAWLFPNHIWKFVLARTLLWSTCAVVSQVFVDSSAEESGGFDFLAGPGWMALAIVLVKFGMSRHSRGTGYFFFAAFFGILVLAIGIITFMTSFSMSGLDFAPPDLEWCGPGTGKVCENYAVPLHGSRPTESTSLCGLSWAMGGAANRSDTVSDVCPDTRLTVLDFAHLSRVSYYIPNETAVNATIKQFLPGWELAHWIHYNITATSGPSRNTFAHLRRGMTDVVSIRGTSSAAELLQDANFFLPAGFLQLAGVVGPSLFDMRSMLSIVTGNITSFRNNQIQTLTDYVNGLVADNKKRIAQGEQSRKLYLTGHSLGGGLAAAVGASVDAEVVTFSSPGLQATSAILNPSPPLDKLRRLVTNVVPATDLVAQVDYQTGVVLPIQCSIPSPFSCHQLRNSMCEILAACGDGGGREIPRHYIRGCDICDLGGQSYEEGNLGSCVSSPLQRTHTNYETRRFGFVL